MAKSKKGVTHTQANLAQPGDPLALSNGEIIESEDTDAIDDNALEELKRIVDPITFRPAERKSLKELPAPVGTINGCAVVFMYTLLGIGDREIADALDITPDQLDAIREHPAYAECFNTVLVRFIDANSELLQSRLAAYSHAALTTTAEIMLHGKKEENKLRAAIDTLDRSGARPQDNVGRQNAGKDHLRIVIIDNEKQIEVSI